jgi:hypothetical protein
MLFNAPTLSFIHTLCVLWAGSKPAYSTIINTHETCIFKYSCNPTPYYLYHGRGPMLHNQGFSDFPIFGLFAGHKTSLTLIPGHTRLTGSNAQTDTIW